MNIKSLGFKTDLIFNRHDGLIIDRGDYIVIKTLKNLHYFWGNYIIFPEPPTEDDYEIWTSIYKKEFSSVREINFIALAWDNPKGEQGDIDKFLEAGFSLNSSKVLTAETVNMPPKFNKDIIVRPIETDEEWNAVIDVQMTDDWYLEADSQRPFLTKQTKTLRDMVNAGFGKRFGAFLENTLVGELGIYFDKDIARFNNVATHRDFRRKGVCGTLVYLASKVAFKEMGAKTLVMVADEDYHAAGIYESVGFKPTEKQLSLEWYNDKIY